MPNGPPAPIPPADRSGPGTRFAGWLLFVATTLGAPGGLLLVLRDEVKGHRWLALGAVVVYELALLVAAMVTKVWRKLESRLVDRIATAIEARVGWLGYRGQYLRHIFYCHRNFDVKGLTTQGIYTLELAHVFVELTIKPSPIHGVSKDPIRPLPEELRGSHQIWDFLTSETLKEQQLAVIGAPGGGKTTLLKNIALTLTKSRHRHKRLRHKLPILLFLRDLAEAIQENNAYSLAQAVSDSLARKLGPVPPAGWIAAQLRDGRCLVLLDGLDEVAKAETRKAVATWVETQTQAHAGNRFIVTSRPFGYQSNPLAGVTLLEVQPFSRDQVRSFVQSWYRANEIMSAGRDDPGVEMEAREGAEDLLRRLQATPTLAALAVNPLLLTMIATVHRYRSSLPGRRVELYDEICEVFLGKRRQARGLDTDLAPSQKQLVLQALAYHLMVTNRRELPASEASEKISEPLAGITGTGDTEAATVFLEMIEQTSGLLLERESGVYGFAHLAFQEHLAAEHIREQRLEEDLVTRVGDPWWHEVIRLFGAKGDASPIIAACLETDPMSPKALVLAFDCIEEAKSVTPELRKRLDQLMEEGVEHKDLHIRRLVAETMLTRRLQRMVPLDDTTSYDPGYTSHAEYQLFLDEKRAAGKYHQPDHWHGFQFPEGQGALPVVGMRPSDASTFCEWLNEREQGPVRYRLPRYGELSGPDFESSGKVGAAEGFWSSTEEGFSFSRVVQLEQGVMEDRLAVVHSVLDRARARDLDRAFERDHTRALERVLERAFDRALERGRDRAINLALALTLALARGRDQALAVAHDIARDIDIDIDLVRARVRALDLALDLARDRALDLDLALDLARDLDRALERDRARAIERARARDFDRALDLDRARTIERDLGLSLETATWLIILKLRKDRDLASFEGLRVVREKLPATQ